MESEKQFKNVVRNEYNSKRIWEMDCIFVNCFIRPFCTYKLIFLKTSFNWRYQGQVWVSKDHKLEWMKVMNINGSNKTFEEGTVGEKVGGSIAVKWRLSLPWKD